jgi:hypothetical protein
MSIQTSALGYSFLSKYHAKDYPPVRRQEASKICKDERIGQKAQEPNRDMSTFTLTPSEEVEYRKKR